MSIGIYKITSPSGRIYIGQTIKSVQRFSSYRRYKCKKQVKLYNSLVKYGFENHKIEFIHELPIDVSRDIIDMYEILYWRLYKDCGFDMLNIKEPGWNGRHNKESIKKISGLNSVWWGVKGKNHPSFGQIPWNKGKKMSKELRNKLSLAHKGQISYMVDKTHTEETKALIKTRMKDRKARGYVSPYRKAIYKYNTKGDLITVYSTQKEIVGCSPTLISKRCYDYGYFLYDSHVWSYKELKNENFEELLKTIKTFKKYDY